MDTPEYYFNIWYVEPLQRLQEIKNGNGGFIGLATSCFLYDRYARAKLKADGKSANDENLIQQLMVDFAIDETTAKTFWDVIRNGLLHQGMPKQRAHGSPISPWRFHADFPTPIELVQKELRVQPWHFMEKVLELWHRNMDLLDQNVSFPWAGVIE